MLRAEDYLHIVRDRGSRGLPLEDVYRQLFNPDLYLKAYGKISVNAGAMTPGATQETADGMSLKKIQAIIERLRSETYRWTPVRRVYIEKKHSVKQRPLGLPVWSDKLLQEVLRLNLEAYYEPQFSSASHGFRPNRGCGTALTAIHHTWKGTIWFIEGDISACFDSLDHSILLSIIRERIHDNRFLRLIDNLLKAGYLEQWHDKPTLSGVPQGGVISPILANIYLDRLDTFAETTLLPAYNRGDKRKPNPAYRTLSRQLARAHRQGQHDTLKRCRQVQRQQPSVLLDDPGYRRLRYIRYADDFLLGFAGPRTEAEVIKQQVGAFLHGIKLELSAAKTLITHGRTETARFLGYDLSVHHAGHVIRAGKRTLTAGISLRVPHAVVQAAAARYRQNNTPIHRAERLNDAVFTIISGYEAEYRGIVEYYRMAINVAALNYLKLVMQTSLVKTLASKLRISAPQVYRRYSARYQGRKVLQVTIERNGKPPLLAVWGKTDLVRRTMHVLNDAPRSPVGPNRTELVKRLLADTCELCGAQDQIEVHHVRALKDLKRPGKAKRPQWMQVMSARRRKTLVLCHVCHVDIQHGKPRRRTRRDTGEPDAVKVARPVRRGADGKGTETTTAAFTEAAVARV